MGPPSKGREVTEGRISIIVCVPASWQSRDQTQPNPLPTLCRKQYIAHSQVNLLVYYTYLQGIRATQGMKWGNDSWTWIMWYNCQKCISWQYMVPCDSHSRVLPYFISRRGNESPLYQEQRLEFQIHAQMHALGWYSMTVYKKVQTPKSDSIVESDCCHCLLRICLLQL